MYRSVGSFAIKPSKVGSETSPASITIFLKLVTSNFEKLVALPILNSIVYFISLVF